MKKIRMCVDTDKTFAEGFEEYILDCKSRNLRDGTLRHYRESIKQIYKRVPSDTLISDLDEYTMIGTRGNVADPLGRIEEQYWDNTRCRFTVILVLDENDESNFNYKYGLGFDTLYYQDMKERIEDAA